MGSGGCAVCRAHWLGQDISLVMTTDLDAVEKDECPEHMSKGESCGHL